MIKKTVSGEGESARDALEALAQGFKDEEVDEAAGMCVVVHLKRGKVRGLRGPDYDGFVAEVVEGEVPAYTDKEIVQEIRRRAVMLDDRDFAFWVRTKLRCPQRS